MIPSPIEQWIEIKGYEGMYAVSSLGRIMSLERKICGMNKERQVCRVIPEIVMVQSEWKYYRQVWLRRPGEHVKFRVHRLVADAFLPNPDVLPVVNHIDGNKGNNAVSNLEWVSYSENTNHYYQKLKPVAAAVEEDEGFKDEDIPF